MWKRKLTISRQFLRAELGLLGRSIRTQFCFNLRKARLEIMAMLGRSDYLLGVTLLLEVAGHQLLQQQKPQVPVPPRGQQSRADAALSLSPHGRSKSCSSCSLTL